MAEKWGVSQEEAARANGRYGRVSQTGTGASPPYWYGKIVDVAGDYLKFERRQGAGRWYHRRDVSLHPERVPDGVKGPEHG